MKEDVSYTRVVKLLCWLGAHKMSFHCIYPGTISLYDKQIFSYFCVCISQTPEAVLSCLKAIADVKIQTFNNILSAAVQQAAIVSLLIFSLS